MNVYEFFTILFAVFVAVIIVWMALTTYEVDQACKAANMKMANAQEDTPSEYARCVTVENETLMYKIVRR